MMDLDSTLLRLEKRVKELEAYRARTEPMLAEYEARTVPADTLAGRRAAAEYEAEATRPVQHEIKYHDIPPAGSSPAGPYAATPPAGSSPAGPYAATPPAGPAPSGTSILETREQPAGVYDETPAEGAGVYPPA